MYECEVIILLLLVWLEELGDIVEGCDEISWLG